MKRSFLFLQGLATPFLARLGDRLRGEGHAVHRINFCAGDALYWGRRPAWNYRGRVGELADDLEQKYAAHGFTDIVLFGDQRPVHRPAIALARARGLAVHVFEEGYVRPYWITLEGGGVNANSALPRDPDWYREVSARLPPQPRAQPVRVPLSVRAAHDMLYHAANLANPLGFPGYRTHRPYLSAIEYAGWARRFSKLAVRQRFDTRLIDRLIAAGTPYFLLPLQLNGDSQITSHSPFRDMGDVLRHVLASFAAHAPPDSHLVIKNHPLDTGLFPYARLIRELVDAHDLGGRVHFVETGDLVALVLNVRGVVTVNSTVGLSAMGHECPTIALGKALYGLPGLTCQQPLDAFWRDPERPDPSLYQAFCKVVIWATQVNGDFFTRAGIELAVGNCSHIVEPQSRLARLLEQYPVKAQPNLRAALTPFLGNGAGGKAVS